MTQKRSRLMHALLKTAKDTEALGILTKPVVLAGRCRAKDWSRLRALKYEEFWCQP